MDLERGPDPVSPYEVYHPNTSQQSGIGAALSNSTRTSIIGSDGPPPAGEEWGPAHPCFPHLNSHVPLSSPLYRSTRIIRIRRDWMLEGDLAPTFSNLYPEILDPAGVSEAEFRQLIDRINREVIEAFNPLGARNLFDGLMGMLTGWVWDDIGAAKVKGRLDRVEKYLEEWNRGMEKKTGGGLDGAAPRVIPLRRTGYMNLDIQIPDPEISYPSAPTEDGSRNGTGVSEQPN